MKKIFLFLLLLVILPTVYAKENHIKLLAVSELPSGYVGSVADLYLDVRPGNGGIYIDTLPLTKMDTQISTRFAKEIACKHLNVECNNNDFFYTIRANTAIVGGPSAGSAVAVITAATLEGLSIDEETAITGTINSGGLIGPVGSLKEKINAAAKKGIKRVLVPKGELVVEEENRTIDLKNFSESVGVELIGVSELGEALYYFTGKEMQQQNTSLVIDTTYENTMKGLAETLCRRGKQLEEEIREGYDGEEVNKSLLVIQNITQKGEKAFSDNKYYSTASFCFGANVRYRDLLLFSQNLSSNEIKNLIAENRRTIRTSYERLGKLSYETLTDLEAFMIVKERLIEAEDFLDATSKSLAVENKREAVYNLAYAIERIYSAYSWSLFFGKGGTKFDLDTDIIKDSCLNKLSETEERIRYVNLFFPLNMQSTRKELSRAYGDLESQNYELCLFKASKAKAEVDIVLNVFGVGENHIGSMLEQKLDIAKKNIIREIEAGRFPILGYSYYEYADTLRDTDKYSALLYSEYALELSNLDLYFEEKKKIRIATFDTLHIGAIFLFASGILFGILIMLPFLKRKEKNKLFIKIKR